MTQYHLVQNNSIPGATNGYHPSPTTYDQNAVEGFCEKLKLENLGYKQRCEQLEQFCRDMWAELKWAADTPYDVEEYRERMEQLGLLEEK